MRRLATAIGKGVHRRAWWISIAAAVVSALVLIRTLDLRAVITLLGRSDLKWIVVAIVANFALLPLLTSEWRLLMPRTARASWPRLWQCLTVSMAGMNTLPLGGGHALAVMLLVARKVTTVSGALSLLALEQLCEGAARVGLLFLALEVAPAPPVMARAAWALAAGVILAILALRFLIRDSRPESAWTRLRKTLAPHLEVLHRPEAFLAGVLFSVAAKACGLVAVVAIQRSLGVEIGWSGAIMVFTAITLGTGIALSPGNVGTYEVVVITACRWLGLTGPVAGALAVLLHVCFLLPVVGTGCLMALAHALAEVRSSAERVKSGGRIPAGDPAHRHGSGVV